VSSRAVRPTSCSTTQARRPRPWQSSRLNSRVWELGVGGPGEVGDRIFAESRQILLLSIFCSETKNTASGRLTNYATPAWRGR
jgi:hypothetical protein